MRRPCPQQMSVDERIARLCDIFGREARLCYPNRRWSDVSQRLSLHWEAMRRPDEPSWAHVQPLVQHAFEDTAARRRGIRRQAGRLRAAS